MSTPLQKALDSMTRYSALKQPPLSTAQGGSTSPFSIFRPSQNSPAPLKKRPSPKENARHPIGGKSGQQGFNKRESLGRGKGGVWGGEGEPYSRKVPLPLPNASLFHRPEQQPEPRDKQRNTQKLPHREPAESQIAELGIWLADKLHGKTEHAVQHREQAGNAPGRTDPGRIDPQ